MPRSFFLNPFGRVCEAIESWRPRGCTTEKDYERSLAKKLEKELLNQKITPQFGSARQRVDIMVDGKVPIEVKKDLKTTAAFQRTVGQLNQYLQDFEGIILVLCGDVSRDLLKDLEAHAKSHDNVYLYRK